VEGSPRVSCNNQKLMDHMVYNFRIQLMKVCVSRRRDAGFGHRLRVKKNQSTDCDTIVTLYRYRSTNRFVSLLLSGLPVRNVQEAPTIWYHDDRRRAQWLSHKKQSFSVCIGLRTEPM